MNMTPQHYLSFTPAWQIILLRAIFFVGPILFVLLLIYFIHRRLNKSKVHRAIYVALLLIPLIFVVLYVSWMFECVTNRAEVGIKINWDEIRDCSY